MAQQRRSWREWGIIYNYGVERFGIQEPRSAKQSTAPPVSRRPQQIMRLVQERRQLRKLWKKASGVEKKCLSTLQADIKISLASLHRSENLRKRRRKKERTRTRFYKDPFKFLKLLFTEKSTRQHTLTLGAMNIWLSLRTSHQWAPQSNSLRQAPLPGKSLRRLFTGQELHQPLGQTEFPTNCIKTHQICRFLWRLMQTVWRKRAIPKVWCRAGGVLIPKEKDASNISQFRPIFLLNVEGTIFFSVIAQRMADYLRRN